MKNFIDAFLNHFFGYNFWWWILFAVCMYALFFGDTSADLVIGGALFVVLIVMLFIDGAIKHYYEELRDEIINKIENHEL